MSNKKKKKNEDRISLLPDYLLHHILSSLNTKEVVQTCVISSRWKTVWTCMPTLNFDFNSFPFKGAVRNSGIIASSFDHFISRFLSKHRGSQITKLIYCAPHSVTQNKKYLVEFWICFAAFRKVQELCINSEYCKVDFEYWTHNFSACQSLTMLKFSSHSECVEDDCEEGGVLMLPLLKSLEIEYLCWNRLQKKMFSGCPNLESLVLINLCCSCKRNASICAPKLEHLDLRGSSSDYVSDWLLDATEIELLTPNLRCVKFNDAFPTVKSGLDFPHLDKVQIAGDFGDELREYGQDQVVELLRAFHNARSITMPLIAIHVLLSVPESVSANFSFHNLRHLKLEASKTCRKIDLPMNELQYLLKCPSLKTVAIDLNLDD